MTIWWIVYPILMLSFFFLFDIVAGRKMTEKTVIRNILHAMLWTLCFITLKNIFLFCLGGLVMIIVTDYYLLSKLYPTSDTKYFTRRKKDAVQCSVPGAEKDSKDILENKDRDITKDHR